jgi:hypothetical protein
MAAGITAIPAEDVPTWSTSAAALPAKKAIAGVAIGAASGSIMAAAQILPFAGAIAMTIGEAIAIETATGATTEGTAERK